MDKQTAEAAYQFMLRVSLRGSEVPAFNTVMAALEKIVKASDTDVKPERT